MRKRPMRAWFWSIVDHFEAIKNFTSLRLQGVARTLSYAQKRNALTATVFIHSYTFVFIRKPLFSLSLISPNFSRNWAWHFLTFFLTFTEINWLNWLTLLLLILYTWTSHCMQRIDYYYKGIYLSSYSHNTVKMSVMLWHYEMCMNNCNKLYKLIMNAKIWGKNMFL